ncbi:alpha/beta hydrolase family protein [Flavobacterium sp. JP2137]|uniref:alpha/beta hydrolase family protein n=1 Tax=Flavobacterium sp. JP2137 TaxID=3414510 RepID=UPI003D30018E
MKAIKSTVFLLAALWFTSGCWALKPEKKYVEHPSNFNFKYKEQKIVTSDGVSLQSWSCFPDAKVDNKTTLILAYGDAGNMSYWLRQVAEMVQAGYTVVLFDYRGFGGSQDFAIDEKYLYYDEFVTDLTAVVQWTKKEVKSDHLGIWSLSMGSIMATLTIAREPVDFLVAEGFVIDPYQIVQVIKEYKQEQYLLPPKAPTYADALSRLQLPCLLFAGLRDGLTTMDDSNRVKFLNPNSELIPFNASHLQGFQSLSGTTHGQKYIDGITAFVAKLYAVHN